MLNLYLLPEAENDLLDILDYSINSFGIEKASQYHYDLSNTMKLLCEQPFLGVSCGYIRQGYRKYHFNKHFIFYLIKDNSNIQVIRIISDKMDYNIHL